MKQCGRNDPCPCGSGKKLKKCCQSKRKPLVAEHLQEGASLTRASSVHRLAHSLLSPLVPKESEPLKEVSPSENKDCEP